MARYRGVVWKQHHAADPIFRDRPDDHGIVTVDLELMGMTLEEYFNDSDLELITAEFQRRVIYHRQRLLCDAPGLVQAYVAQCERNALPEIVVDMSPAQCSRALRLLEELCLEAGMGTRARTNWEAVQ